MDLIEEFYDDLRAEIDKARAAGSPAVPIIENRQDVPMAPINAPDTVEVEVREDP